MKRLPAAGLTVEFWVDPIEESLDEERFQFLHLATDQVRFANERRRADRARSRSRRCCSPS